MQYIQTPTHIYCGWNNWPHAPLLLAESSEHEDKSAGASGETPSQPYPAPVYSQPEELKDQMDDTKPTKPEENEDSDPLPDNWEMAYTEKGEVYFIEWVSDISLNIVPKIIARY